jgi:hypothetical protein
MGNCNFLFLSCHLHSFQADGYITGNSRYLLQRETNWQLHSGRHNFVNPTWPTEWRQFMPLIA